MGLGRGLITVGCGEERVKGGMPERGKESRNVLERSKLGFRYRWDVLKNSIDDDCVRRGDTVGYIRNNDERKVETILARNN